MLRSGATLNALLQAVEGEAQVRVLSSLCAGVGSTLAVN